MLPSSRHFLALSLLAVAVPSPAQDWPQFLGPNRDLTTASTNVNLVWTGAEPPIRWKKEVGSGWSGPIVADGSLVLHHRIKNEEVVACFDALTGEPRWETRQPTAFRNSLSSDDGPRATPAIAGGRVFTFGAEGKLNCIDLADGKLRWTVDTKQRFEADAGFFGPACSPLVEGGLVLMQVGGKDGHGIVAFETETGKVRWKATDHEAGYSSPTVATIGERRYALFFTRSGLVATDPRTGQLKIQFPWRSREHASVNAATPLVTPHGIFLSASYGTGAVMLRMRGELAEPAWQGNDQLSNHYATSVYQRGMLFGFHGRVDFPPGAELRCVDARTGVVLWRFDPIENGSVMLVNDQLLVLSGHGEFFAGPATSKLFKPSVRAQLLGIDTRANAAFAQGIYYARGKGKLVAVDLRAASGK